MVSSRPQTHARTWRQGPIQKEWGPSLSLRPCPPVFQEHLPSELHFPSPKFFHTKLRRIITKWNLWFLPMPDNNSFKAWKALPRYRITNISIFTAVRHYKIVKWSLPFINTTLKVFRTVPTVLLAMHVTLTNPYLSLIRWFLITKLAFLDTLKFKFPVALISQRMDGFGSPCVSQNIIFNAPSGITYSVLLFVIIGAV